MPDDNNPTTRRYPRTTGEAFRGANYADPIERPGDQWSHRGRIRMRDVLLATAIGVALAAVLFFNL
jgi:hypothetical protein